MSKETRFKPFLMGTYGTLMSGFHNNRLLGNSKYLGETTTDDTGFDMYSVGGFPGVIKNAVDGSQIKLEVYEITDWQIADRIDYLEGYPNLYTKAVVDTFDFGPVTIYIFNRSIKGLKKVKSGDWREFIMQEQLNG